MAGYLLPRRGYGLRVSLPLGVVATMLATLPRCPPGPADPGHRGGAGAWRERLNPRRSQTTL
ncbi:hypothetical protein ACFXG6_06005 [Streptomyces roseus]|uniref:hypothetical protein n=1 Tax=Streptomyces roseus TaxID=66430 RepID=UPI0036C5802B